MEIIPYVSAGLLKLNMKKREIQSIIDESPEAFTKWEEEPAEHYVQSGIIVYYNEDGETSNAFEFVQNSNPTLNGVNYLTKKYATAKSLLRELDNEIVEDEDTIITFKYGISLYILNDKVESLLVFEEGYYDEYFELLKELEELSPEKQA